MKYLKLILVVTTILTLSLTVVSSYGLSTKLVDTKTNTGHTIQNNILNTPNLSTKVDASDDHQTKELHGDVWFAFSAIGVIGAYLVFKK